jgi:hypothetical protein
MSSHLAAFLFTGEVWQLAWDALRLGLLLHLYISFSERR